MTTNANTMIASEPPNRGTDTNTIADCQATLTAQEGSDLGTLKHQPDDQALEEIYAARRDLSAEEDASNRGDAVITILESTHFADGNYDDDNYPTRD